MASEIILKPCPFCGGKAELAFTKGVTMGDLYWVHCTQCRIATPVEDKVKVATAVWNRSVWKGDAK